MSSLLFFTEFNYQKIAINDSATVSVPDSATWQAYSYSHNLGYIPTARMFYRYTDSILGDGEGDILTPVDGEQYSSFNGSGITRDLVCRGYVTSSNVVFEVDNRTSSSISTTFYWRVYYDA